MTILAVGLAPSPLGAVPEINPSEAKKLKKTREGLTELGRRLAAFRPDAVVVITPQGPVIPNSFAYWSLGEISGDLSRHGASEVKLTRGIDRHFSDLTGKVATNAGIPTVAVDALIAREKGLETSLDHGVLVPLYFFDRAGLRCPLAVFSVGTMPPGKLYRFGGALVRSARVLGRRIVVVASGGLPAPISTPVSRALKDGDLWPLLDPAAEVGRQGREVWPLPLVAAIGVFEGIPIKTRVISQEDSRGEGLTVALIEPDGRAQAALAAVAAAPEEDPGRERWLLPRLRKARRYALGLGEPDRGESPPAALARCAVEAYVRTGKKISPPIPLAPELIGRAGVRVTVEAEGEFRASAETAAPTKANLASEIIHNAIAVATGAPPVTEEELDELTYTVEVFGPEPARYQ